MRKMMMACTSCDVLVRLERKGKIKTGKLNQEKIKDASVQVIVAEGEDREDSEENLGLGVYQVQRAPEDPRERKGQTDKKENPDSKA